MNERKNEARWLEKYQRWQINVQKDGKRKTFWYCQDFCAKLSANSVVDEVIQQ